MKKDFRIWQFDYLGHVLGTRRYEAITASQVARFTAPEVLDVGCGDYAPWKYLFPPPARYTGLDVVARPGVDVVASAERMPFADNSFDLIFSNGVLEHIPDVVATTSEMHRVLRPGGSVILGTHGTWPIHGAPHDYRRWTPHGLRFEFSAFRSFEIEQLGGPLANFMIIINWYLRRIQESSALGRLLLAPWVTLNNVLGRAFPGDPRKPATIPVFYIITATK